jgi:hypothetical protein
MYSYTMQYCNDVPRKNVISGSHRYLGMRFPKG